MQRSSAAPRPTQQTFGPMELRATSDEPNNSESLAQMNAAIDRSGIQRKVLAADLGLSESQFSRLTSGVQGFPIALLDRLPASIVLDYLDRMAHERGAHVEREDAAVMAATRLVEAALAFVRVKAQMAKAG